MAEKPRTERTPSNEEIVDELIKGLDITSPDKKDEKGDNPGENIPESVEELKNQIYDDVPGDFENDEPKKDPLLIDDVDEEEFKKREESLTDEEKETFRKEALDLKQIGNDQFKTGQYLESINTYTKALNICPLAYPSDRSIFYCNRAASKMHLERTDLAIDDCTQAINLNNSYLKAYVRRAKLYEAKEKLDECLEDYKKVLELDPGHAEARAACVRLPPLINERNEKLKTEMMGKLKDLGNMILKPFGLSTNNFNLQQDPNTGGYSVNFSQNKSS